MKSETAKILDPGPALDRFEAMAARQPRSDLTKLTALSAWSAAALLALIVAGAETSYAQLSVLTSLWGGVTIESVTAGAWWSAAILWLIQGLRLRSDATGRRPLVGVGLRLYVAIAFTLLGVIESVGHGFAGGLGFFAGVGACASVWSAVDVSWTLAGRLASDSRRRQEPSDQLSLPFV